MKINELNSNSFISTIDALYGVEKREYQLARYRDLMEEHIKLYGTEPVFCSAPGRIEICGNHTDHNCGKVFAASVNLDIIAV